MHYLPARPYDVPLRRQSIRPVAPIAAIALLTLVVLASGCSHPAEMKPAVIAPAPSLSVTTIPATFEDVTDAAGLNYRWTITAKRPLNILQTIGNGCAFLDYNNDGNLDILLLGPKLALYRGDGHGHFTDVTHETGLDKLHGHFLGCAAGDYDNDGYDDLYISGYQTGLLLHNEADRPPHPPTPSPTREEGESEKRSRIPSTLASGSSGKGGSRAFRDVTASSGLKMQPWGTSAAWVESVPGSGRLDLFVANYAHFGPEKGIPQLCLFNGIPSSCGPSYYPPIQGTLYRNLGNGHFANVSAASGIGTSSGRGLGLAFADLDGSGHSALAIANDEMPGDLLLPQNNNNAPHYTNIGAAAGIAYDRDGNKHGGMGLDWGDYDNDGKLDLLVTTFQNEAKSLYHNDGNRQFSDVSFASGLGTTMAPHVSFGCKLFDFDNDGWLDLIIASGHVQDNIEQIDTSTHYRQPTHIFHNQGGSGQVNAAMQFADVSATAGVAFQTPIVGRGLAVGDYDNDGKMDVLVVNSEGKPLLLHNQTQPTGHWLGVRLIGVKCNRDGYGALLTAQFAGRALLRHCHADGSYLSSSDARVHFGFGAATHVETLTIRWPDGRKEVLHNLPADRYLTVIEGKGISAAPITLERTALQHP